MEALPVFNVDVDYDLDLRKLIRAGKYADADPDIARDHFPKERAGRKKINLVLFEFKNPIPAVETGGIFAGKGLRPATLFEVLAFGAKYIEEQFRFPIMALGSSWVNGNGEKGYPYIWKYSNERFVALYWYGNAIHTYFRFAAVERKRISHGES